jgi:hypothetical protein
MTPAQWERAKTKAINRFWRMEYLKIAGAAVAMIGGLATFGAFLEAPGTVTSKEYWNLEALKARQALTEVQERDRKALCAWGPDVVEGARKAPDSAKRLEKMAEDGCPVPEPIRKLGVKLFANSK